MPFHPTSLAPLALVAALGLAACKPAATEQASPAPADNAATTGTVERQQVVAAEPAAPTQAAIQTQPGPGGSQVSLNKAHVTGDVLTIQLTYAGGKGSQYMKMDEVSLIDDATAQRIGVLKDNGGKWLAAPLSINGEAVSISMFSDAPVIVWFKFPAPPATSKTVSLNLPEAAPFDGVPVTR